MKEKITYNLVEGLNNMTLSRISRPCTCLLDWSTRQDEVTQIKWLTFQGERAKHILAVLQTFSAFQQYFYKYSAANCNYPYNYAVLPSFPAVIWKNLYIHMLWSMFKANSK